MMTKRFTTLTAVTFATVAGFFLGCSSKPASTSSVKSTTGAAPSKDAQQQAAAHDPDDIPITEDDVDIPSDYASLVVRVEQLVDDVRDKIAAGAPTKAHRSLDELDIILKRMPEIASQTVPKEHWRAVNIQSKELAAAHDELHEKIDEKQNPDYRVVAQRIQKALESLKSVPAN